MSAPRAVAVVGFKKAGKTSVVEALVRELTRRGLRVGTLKHGSEAHPLDTPGKDTWRHREAGSVASAILTSKGSAVFLNFPVSISDAVAKLGPLDMIVIEGFKTLDTVPRIIVPRSSEEAEELSNGLEIAISAPSAEELTGIKGNTPIIPLNNVEELADMVEEKAFPLLPELDCRGCGYESCGDLARAIVKGDAEARQCISLPTGPIRLRVDGRDVDLKPFVQDVIGNAVIGMVRSLKGVEKPRKIELSIDVGELDDD